MEKLTFNEFLVVVEKSRQYMPNLDGYSDAELWDLLPNQDPRYAGTESDLAARITDLLGDIEYKE